MSLRNAGVSAAILAGGFSVRMGRDKASLPFGDVSLLEHQAQKLRMLGIEDIMISGSGMEIAARIYERHKLLTQLLISLGVSEETAREDACKIEHDLSIETFDAIREHARRYSSAHVE